MISFDTRTTVVHCRKSNYDVYIGRPSVWGNPFVIGLDGNREEVIEKYKNYFLSQPKLVKQAIHTLRGKKLGCFCHPKRCHGDVIAETVNSYWKSRTV